MSVPAFVTTAASRIPKRVVHTVAVVVGAAAIAAATALSFSPAIAGPRHVCHGYVETPPKHPNSDLYGGAITQWQPKCWLIK